MAKLIFAMNVSLDGYVDHDHKDMMPDKVLFRHFIEMTKGIAGSIYGRRLYELMQYWDEDQPGWSPEEREFAQAWRRQPKWVVSRTLTEVGPNATLIKDDVEAAIRRLKDELQGEIDVGGTVLAHWLGERGLLDEVHMYLRPVVLGTGRPMFVGPRPPMRLLGSERIGEDVIRLRYGAG
ncbi:dihydrofolate reductase family protein [Tabrizicola sp.]|uniref:dihydrofolate reductase family protein n=1 Tax=Tabrizicola sp. TaxID=2005166 RepID=UPI00286B3463|nr:dihydrofolate reductase family protein [Tabrizicola sp.]